MVNDESWDKIYYCESVGHVVDWESGCKVREREWVERTLL